MRTLAILGLLGCMAIPLHATPTVEVADFFWREDGIDHVVKIAWDGRMLRVDTPFHQFAVIADTQIQDYTGLEIRDAKFWHFSWPRIKSVIDKSRQHTTELNTPLLSDSSKPNSSIATPTYVWTKTSSLKSIGAVRCQLWETTDEYQRRVRLWCSAEAGAPSRELWKNYLATEEILKLVAVRTLGPSLSPAAFAALPENAGSPLEITVGDEEDSDRLSLKELHQVPPSPDLFQPPHYYELSPLAALEGVE